MGHFNEAVREVFASLGPIDIQRMFGAHGVWHAGRMCALLSQDQLYLKTDASSRAAFDALALPAFNYTRQGVLTSTSYRLAPEAVFESREQAAHWTRLSWEAALRQGARTARRTAKTNGRSAGKGS